MAKELYKEGTYPARIVDHDLQPTEDGTALKSVVVSFEFQEEGKENPSKITWFGSVKGGALPITLENLLRMGYKGQSDEDFMKLARFNGEGMPLSPMVLDDQKDLEIVIKHDTYNNKTTAKVAFINEPGRGALKRMQGSAAKPILAGLNIGGELAALRAKNPGIGQPAAAGGETMTVRGQNVPF